METKTVIFVHNLTISDMKYLFCVLLLTAYLFCAGSKIAKKPINSTSIYKSSANKNRAANPNLMSVIKGVWVNKKYLDMLLKTKSASASWGSLGNTISLFIYNNQKPGNSLFVSYRTNNHEGGNDTILFNLNKKSNSLIEKPKKEKNANYHEINYLVKNKDTLLMMSYHNLKTHLITQALYVKVPNNLQGTESDEIQIMINHLLFSGKYTLTDLAGNKSHIRLTADGRVIGHSQFRTYYVNSDFTMDAPGERTDEILLYTEGNYLRSGLSYNYKLKNNIINLYDLKSAKDTGYLNSKNLVYKLIKEQ